MTKDFHQGIHRQAFIQISGDDISMKLDTTNENDHGDTVLTSILSTLGVDIIIAVIYLVIFYILKRYCDKDARSQHPHKADQQQSLREDILAEVGAGKQDESSEDPVVDRESINT